MILRTILAVLVVIATLYYYHDKKDVSVGCVAIVAASLVAQIMIVQWGNLYPLLRAWLIIGCVAAFVYPLDLAKTHAYDIPTYGSCVAALIGCAVVGFWSVAEGRTFWLGRRISVKANKKNVG